MSTKVASQGTGEARASNEWIDRYVNEVGRRLPVAQRADVEQEIRSLIEDEVAGRLDALGADGVVQPDTEVTVLEVLEQFGSPEEMAARYHAPRYLIGPTLLPIFQIVLGVVLAVTLFANLFGLAVAAGTGGVDPLIDMLLNLFASIIQATGMVTLIFAILERLGVAADNKPQAWNPRSLPAVKDTQRVSVVETAVDIGFTTAVLILANFYLNRGTGAVYINGEWQAIPLFSQEFLQYIPWLTIVWVADILVNIVLLVRGRWETTTRIATMILAAATGFIFYRMIAGGPIAAWPPVDPAFKVTAAIIFAISLFEVAKQGWQLLRNSTWGARTLQSQHVV
jgi:hypothetical protein